MKTPSFAASTQSYESWLGRAVPIVQPQLRLKHERMIETPFTFLRATFYRWMQLWHEVCPEFRKVPTVLAVGDLHLENFGTWRDQDGRLIWGINDFDEAYPLPYTLDLVRLAVSARLAIKSGQFKVDIQDAIDNLLEGFELSLEQGGHAFVLEEHNRWLRQLAMSELRDPHVFWDRLSRLPPAKGKFLKSATRVLESAFPVSDLEPQYLSRIAGLGSLGRPRVVALAEWGGGYICREAKAVAPSAGAWALGKKPSAKTFIMKAIKRARRIQDPYYGVDGAWLVRRLAPHCSKIDIAHLPRKRDELELLQAMGMETANVHLGSRPAREILRDLKGGRRKQITKAVERMTHLVLEDWEKARAQK